MQADRVESARRPRAKRKRLPNTNGTKVGSGVRLHAVGDGRGIWGRRFAEVLGNITAINGGLDALDEEQRQLIRRAATIAISCEQVECRLAQGEEIDADSYGQMSDRMGRALSRLAEIRAARAPAPPPPRLDDDGRPITKWAAFLRALTLAQLQHLRLIRYAHMPRAGEQSREPTDEELERLRLHLVESAPPLPPARPPQDPDPETPIRRYTRQMTERNIAVRGLTDDELVALPPIDVPNEARGQRSLDRC